MTPKQDFHEVLVAWDGWKFPCNTCPMGMWGKRAIRFFGKGLVRGQTTLVASKGRVVARGILLEVRVDRTVPGGLRLPNRLISLKG